MKKLIIYTLLFVALPLMAQNEDFETWTNFSLSGELFKDIDFSVEPELRFFDNASRLSCWQSDFSLSKALSKRLDVGLFYRYRVNYEVENYNQRMHRLGAFLKLNYKTGKFIWSYKAQLQRQHTNWKTSEDGAIAEMAHRHKLMVKYKRKKNFVNPSVGVEYNFALSPAEEVGTWKRRLYFSIDKQLTKKVSIDLSYRRQEEYGVAEPETLNILFIGMGYEL